MDFPRLLLFLFFIFFIVIFYVRVKTLLDSTTYTRGVRTRKSRRRGHVTHAVLVQSTEIATRPVKICTAADVVPTSRDSSILYCAGGGLTGRFPQRLPALNSFRKSDCTHVKYGTQPGTERQLFSGRHRS